MPPRIATVNVVRGRRLRYGEAITAWVAPEAGGAAYRIGGSTV